MIQLERVTKRFGRNRVLDAICLDIARGERVALVGANGAGKTTLFRCLLGEYRFDGALRIDGRSPRRDRRAVLARVGFVPQLPPPLRMPVGQLLGFAARLCGDDVAQMEAVAERLGLEVGPVRRLPFVQLSGGQKQKILIAVALRDGADLLVMDEPAANLDPDARHEFFAMLAERRATDTMLMSIHRLDDVVQLVSRLLELDQGRIVLDRPVRAGASEACDVQSA